MKGIKIEVRQMETQNVTTKIKFMNEKEESSMKVRDFVINEVRWIA